MWLWNNAHHPCDPQDSVLLSVERRESTPLLEKFKVSEVTLAQQVKVVAALDKQKEVKKKAKQANDKTPMMKYLKTQVCGLLLSQTLPHFRLCAPPIPSSAVPSTSSPSLLSPPLHKIR